MRILAGCVITLGIGGLLWGGLRTHSALQMSSSSSVASLEAEASKQDSAGLAKVEPETPEEASEPGGLAAAVTPSPADLAVPDLDSQSEPPKASEHVSRPSSERASATQRGTQPQRQSNSVTQVAPAFIKVYRNQTLPTAVDILKLTPLIQVSGLPDREKLAAIGLLRRFTNVVAQGVIPPDQAKAMLRLLVGNTPAEEYFQTHIPAEQFRAWLIYLDRGLIGLPPQAFTLSPVLEQELNDAYEASLP